MNRLLDYISKSVSLVDRRLEELLPFAQQRPETLHEAIRYSVLGGGKRLRPILTLAAFDAVSRDGSNRFAALDAGCSVELIHAYSLVHDDLPAMDNDVLRRNRLTCHKAFGEAIAILAGDALQALAFSTLAAALPEKAAFTVRELAQASGSTGMVGGQMLDLESEGSLQDLELIGQIDRWKTGAIIACCCRLGAIIADSDTIELEKLTAYGQAIGLLYQITDDLLDITSNTKNLGKSTGKDAKAGKLTYPAALGVKGARELALETAGKAKSEIAGFNKNALMLRMLVDYILERKK